MGGREPPPPLKASAHPSRPLLTLFGRSGCTGSARGTGHLLGRLGRVARTELFQRGGFGKSPWLTRAVEGAITFGSWRGTGCNVRCTLLGSGPTLGLSKSKLVQGNPGSSRDRRRGPSYSNLPLDGPRPVRGSDFEDEWNRLHAGLLDGAASFTAVHGSSGGTDRLRGPRFGLL
jgi:hypothetical protein